MSRGFTLIEMLGVIVIIGVLSLIIGSTVSKNISDSRYDTCSAQEKNIIDSARVYYTDNPSLLPSSNKVTVKVSVLENLGYIEKNLKNPMTGKSYSSEYVEVSALTDADGDVSYDYAVIYPNGGSCE